MTRTVRLSQVTGTPGDGSVRDLVFQPALVGFKGFPCEEAAVPDQPNPWSANQTPHRSRCCAPGLSGSKITRSNSSDFEPRADKGRWIRGWIVLNCGTVGLTLVVTVDLEVMGIISSSYTQHRDASK